MAKHAATVREIYKLALAKLFEKENEDADFQTACPMLLNQLLMQALPYENMIRRADGREVIEPWEVPWYDSITDDEIGWDERILRAAIPDALAGLFMADDDSKKTEAVMQYNRFVQQLSETAPAVFVDFAGDGEAE